MPEMRTWVLEPYCPRCGSYKGIGDCSNIDCKNASGSIIEPTKTCKKCGQPAVVVCARCDSGFCRHHSSHTTSSKFLVFNQCVGTCSKCRQVVCENCWILGEKREISCVIHLEKD